MRVQTPEAMLAFYQRLNRPKDQEKIKFLKGHLKQAAKKPKDFYSIAGAYEHLPRETKKLVGMLALGGGLYGAAKMRPIFKDLERRAELQQQGKTAAARVGRRGWNFKVQRKFPASATKGLKKIRGSTKKFTRSSVAKPRFGNR
ncbi:MAG: hypothetical protein GWN87_28585 [Desulfuromonadales bacterium]|nr:hypothetical protein [Desulfuromonadales bacterium]